MSYVAKCDFCGKVADKSGKDQLGYRVGGLPEGWRMIAPYDADHGEHWCGDCDPRTVASRTKDTSNRLLCAYESNDGTRCSNTPSEYSPFCEEHE